MRKTVLISVLLAGLNAQAYVPVAAIDPVSGAVVLTAKGFVVCGMDNNESRVQKRGGDYGFFAREGLAFARVLTSPLNLVLPYFGICNAFEDETSKFEYFVAAPGMIALSAFCGVASTVDEVCVGAFEILTSMQVKRVYYPWESYSVSYDVTRDAIRSGRAAKAGEGKDKDMNVNKESYD